MASHDDLHQHIASGAAVDAGFALAGQPFALAVVDTGGDIHLKALAHGHISGSMAVRTFFLDDLAGPVAVGQVCTFRTVPKKDCWVNTTWPLPPHLGQVTGWGAGLRSGSVAGSCTLLHIQLDGLGSAEYRFLKSDMHAGAQVRALHRCVSGASAPAGTAAEEISENISENISEISAAEIKAAEAAARAAVKRSMAELIVLASFLRIAENGVCLGSLLEFFSRLLCHRDWRQDDIFSRGPCMPFSARPRRHFCRLREPHNNLSSVPPCHSSKPLDTTPRDTAVPLVSLFSVFFLSAENLLPQAIRYFIPL